MRRPASRLPRPDAIGRARRAGRGAVGWVLGGVATLRAGAAAESRRRRIAWAVVGALLVVGPVGFTLARADSFSAEVELFPRRVGPYPPVYDPGYYREFLADRELRLQMQLNAGATADEYDHATIRPRGTRGPLVLSVSAPTPRRAQALTNALAPQLSGATRRDLSVLLAGDVAEARRRLDEERDDDTRGRLRRRMARYDRLRSAPQERAVLGAQAGVPEPTRWADKLVDTLPGAFPGRPSPVWAGLAGLLLAATLWAVALFVVPPRRRP